MDRDLVTARLMMNGDDRGEPTETGAEQSARPAPDQPNGQDKDPTPAKRHPRRAAGELDPDALAEERLARRRARLPENTHHDHPDTVILPRPGGITRPPIDADAKTRSPLFTKSPATPEAERDQDGQDEITTSPTDPGDQQDALAATPPPPDTVDPDEPAGVAPAPTDRPLTVFPGDAMVPPLPRRAPLFGAPRRGAPRAPASPAAPLFQRKDTPTEITAPDETFAEEPPTQPETVYVPRSSGGSVASTPDPTGGRSALRAVQDVPTPAAPLPGVRPDMRVAPKGGGVRSAGRAPAMALGTALAVLLGLIVFAIILTSR
ncbi:MAG: hypothetical protein AAGA32_02540 [Pseudomonadota bacterium]